MAEQYREEAPVTVYDDLQSDEAVYDHHYTKSFYYPVMREALRQIRRLNGREVLEVGCGSGSFAHLLTDRTDLDYHGFDFSPVGVEKAMRRLARDDLFYIGDARRAESYNRYPYDTIVCMEVLEHVTADRQVVQNWQPGTNCVCTIPNFDYQTHVRYFVDEAQVEERYGDLIDIDRINRVPKPLFLGLTFREYFRKLRWSRNNPKKFFGLLGLNTFEYVAGWFVFSGVRNNHRPGL